MNNKIRIHKQLTLLSLYIAQSIPMSFFSSVVPVLMREGNYSLESIGMLQLIKFPWIFKLLWAPFVDNKTSSLGDYKRWIFGSEFFYAIVITIISLLSLETDFKLIVVLMVIALVASATQDIATDALSIRMLEHKERSLGASMQSMGSFIGTLVGSGVLLIIYSRFGWRSLLVGLAVFVLLALIPLVFYKREFKSSSSRQEVKKITLADILSFFRQKSIYKQVIFLILFYAGIISILSMLRPYLVDLGYSKEEIGVLFGVIGTATATVCSFISGLLIRRFGKSRCRVAYAFIIFLVTAYMFWLSLGHTEPVFIYSGVILIWASYGMATVVVYNVAMDLARERREGTDFTLQTVLTHLSGIILAVLSGQIAGKFSYSMLFLFGMLLSFASFFYNLFFNRKNI